MNENILVIGGAGFIGSHTFVSLIEQGYESAIVDNFSNSDRGVLKGIQKITGKKPRFYEGDSMDEGFLKTVFRKEKNVKGVIHFAAYKAVSESVKEPLKYYDNNLNSLIVLLRLMKENGVAPLVYSSSCTVYGQPEHNPVTEETPLKEAESPYGNTKKICEDIVRDTVKSGEALKAIALRYFNPIGAHPSGHIGELPLGVPENLVPYVTQTAAGIREQLTVFGSDYATTDGSCIRDYIHVMDLAMAHIKSFEYLRNVKKKNFYEVFNVGTGRGNSVLELIKIFQAATGVKLNYKIGPRRPGDIEQIYANVDKIQKSLGWKASRTLNEALADAWRWQQNIGKK